MITVYHLRVSRSERILWLLEEIGIDYRIETFDRDPTFRAPAAMREIHPLGKSPMIRDGDQVIVESGAIVAHLVENHAPGLAPKPGDPSRPRYLEWLHWSEGSLAAWLMMDLVVNGGLVAGVEPGPLKDLLAREIAASLDWVEGELEGQSFACGDEFTAADPMLAWVLRFAQARGHSGGHPTLEAYVDRMTQRNAYQRAIQKAA